MTERRLHRWSKRLAISWFILVGVAAAGLAGLLLAPNEVTFVVGPTRALWYALSALLVIATLGLPLLVVAAILHQRARGEQER